MQQLGPTVLMQETPDPRAGIHPRVPSVTYGNPQLPEEETEAPRGEATQPGGGRGWV